MAGRGAKDPEHKTVLLSSFTSRDNVKIYRQEKRRLEISCLGGPLGSFSSDC